jgi:hypothetical protein
VVDFLPRNHKDLSSYHGTTKIISLDFHSNCVNLVYIHFGNKESGFLKIKRLTKLNYKLSNN